MSLQKNENQHVVDVSVTRARINGVLDAMEGIKRWYSFQTDLDWIGEENFILHIHAGSENDAAAIEEYLVYLGWSVL